jgi:hypothetical protein
MEATSAVISHDYLARSGLYIKENRNNLTTCLFDKHFRCEVTCVTERRWNTPLDKQQTTMICMKRRVRNRTRTVIHLKVPGVSHDGTGAILWYDRSLN